jgi:hypothetical protein
MSVPLTHLRLEIEGQEQSVQDLFNHLVAFLKKHSDLAYTENELREPLLGKIPSHYDAQLLHEALLVLTEEGVLDQRTVRGSDYYAFPRDIDEA